MKAILDHVGIAVKDLDASLAFFRDALGLEVERAGRRPVAARARAVHRNRARRRSSCCRRPSPDSPIAKFLEKRGPGCTTSRSESTTSTPRSRSCGSASVRLIDDEPQARRRGCAASRSSIRRAPRACSWS